MKRYEHITDKKRDEVRALIVEEYTRGRSIRYIAAELGRSYGFVHRMLLEQPDMVLRSRGTRGRQQQVVAAAWAGVEISDSPAEEVPPQPVVEEAAAELSSIDELVVPVPSGILEDIFDY
jgi:hypothetical protein